MELCQERRGRYLGMEYIEASRAVLRYDLPLNEIIYDFFKTDDEYTDRMALQALAEIYPEQAERYAVDFWERKKYEYDEYQKIMVLHVLFQIHSPKLPHYLALAEKSEYRYLRENAEDLYDRLSREPHNG